jgi:hypothetical protein
MHIPKGSLIIPNTTYGSIVAHQTFGLTLYGSGILNDERHYRDSKVFYPERYIPEPAGYGENLPIAAFGYGRRLVLFQLDHLLSP